MNHYTPKKDAFYSVHVSSTIRTDNEVQTSMSPVLSTQVYGNSSPTPPTQTHPLMHHEPILRDNFGINGGGDYHSSDETEENGSLVNDSNICFGSWDMYPVEDLLKVGKQEK